MLYRQLTDSCFEGAIGEHGLSEREYADTLAEAAPALDDLRSAYERRRLPLLALPEAREDLRALQGIADRYRQSFADVVVLGTGGSSLGARALCALADAGFGPLAGAPRLWFMDNVDPHSFEALFARLEPARTGFLVVSKSGGTAETLCQFLTALEVMRAALGEGTLAPHFTVVTEAADNPLRRLATRFRIKALDHDPGLGGRYAVLSLVGLLPAMIAGLDAEAVRAGAAEVLRAAVSAEAAGRCAPVVGAAVSVALARHRFLGTGVIMPYADRLDGLAMWYRQLWAESLGKQGRGTTPVRALGTVDQHSQLQLYLDGPRDKMFTLIALDSPGPARPVDSRLAAEAGLEWLAGRALGDLLAAECRATAETLARHGRPVRLFRLESLDEAAMGALMMHFMLETVVAARLFGVDPFDQPAVEEGKVLAREYLSRTAPAGGAPAAPGAE